MGVPIGEADGDNPLLLECRSCGDQYETDETMMNDCPHCGSQRFDVVSGDPSDWR